MQLDTLAMCIGFLIRTCTCGNIVTGNTILGNIIPVNFLAMGNPCIFYNGFNYLDDCYLELILPIVCDRHKSL